jgi:ribose 5-phosphate isomerase B
MKVYFATDHSGYALKNTLLAFVRDELGYDVEDCGAYVTNEDDDYPDFVGAAAEKVSMDPLMCRAIVIGGSGQGEAMCANRFPFVRAGVFYGERGTQIDAVGHVLDVVTSMRTHNDANVLSLGARFVTVDEAKEAVRAFLATSFEGEERHVRRIKKLG